MDESEIIGRFGVDGSDVTKGIDSILGDLGRLESVGGPAMARGVSRASSELLKLQAAFGTTGTAVQAGSKKVADQAGEFDKLEQKLKRASDAYTTFLRAQATGANPAGKGLGSYSLAQLTKMQTTAQAGMASGEGTTASSTFVSALNKEIAARKQQLSQIDSETISATKKLDAERVAEEEATQRRITELMTAEEQRRAQVAKGVAEAAAAVQKRIADNAASNENTRTVDTARYAVRQPTGLVAPGGQMGGMPTGEVRTTMSNVANGSNTASLNVMNATQASESMRQYYDSLGLVEKETGLTTKSTSVFGVSLGELDKNLPRLRYALYDVSTSMSIVSAGFIAQGLAVFKTNVEYEKLYASVARTSGLNANTDSGRQQIDALRTSLVNLTTQIPVTFADVTNIATLAGQLGISADQIGSFTKTVAEFSATTNVSVDAAATAFGRLSQIITEPNGTKASVSAMADEIAYLGVRSVATESQIIGVASQIAVTTNQAHFGSQATLALATALASLGVKQEAARGSFIRAFGAIDAAVRLPGKALNDLGTISGLGAEQFKKDWGTNAPDAFRKFVAGLGSSSGSVKQNLADLHITAARDVQTFALLAQNTDLLNKSFTDAGNASGYLDKAFAQQTNTVAGRLTLLQNTIKATFDNIGASANGPLTAVLNVVLGLTRQLDDLTKNPAQAWMFAMAAAAVGLIGVGTLLVGVFARIAGSYLALVQTSEAVDLSEHKVIATFLQMIGITQKATAANVELAGSQELVGKTAGGGLASGLGTAGGAGSKLTGIIGKLGLYGAIAGLVLLMPSIIGAFKDWWNEITGFTPSIDTLTQKILHLSDAASKVGSLKEIKTALSGANIDKSGGGVDTYAAVNRNDGTTTQIGAYQGAVNDIAKGNRTPGADVSFLAGGASFNAQTDDAKKQISDYDQALASLVQSGNMEAVRRGIAAYDAQMKANGVNSKDAEAALTATATALGGVGDKGLSAAAGVKAAADAAANATQVFSTTLQDIFGQGVADEKVQTSLTTLGTNIKSTGAAAALNGKDIVAALTDIAAASPPKQAAANMLGLADSLQKAGLATSAQTANIVAAAYALDAGAVAATGYGKAAVDAAEKAGNAAASSTLKTQRAAGTLVGYAQDLSGVLSRAFTFRTGDQTALDAVTKGYLDLKTNANDAALNLKKVQAELKALNATNVQLRYQASVASEYGDTTRGQVINATLSTNINDIATKKKEEAVAQAAASKELKGNSLAAIDNRSKLLSLVDTGQKYLVQLAQNGTSQADLAKQAGKLKSQFIDQATQMGYNRSDVQKLAASFDDFRTVIQKVPRVIDVKVNANTDPAQAAINEFLARNKQITVNVKTTADKPAAQAAGSDIRTAIDQGILNGHAAQANKNAVQMAAQDKANAPSRQPLQETGPLGWLLSLFGMSSSTPTSNTAHVGYNGYASGGYTGDMPANQIAGFVHGREFVLNERATAMIPRQVLDSWNQGVPASSPTVTLKGGGGGSAGGSILTRDDRAFLAAALTRAPSVAISADQFGRAIDGAFVRAGQRGSA